MDFLYAIVTLLSLIIEFNLLACLTIYVPIV